ncbi:ABC transporter ATP-binding protein [Thermosipho atlanticus]|uniref:ABC-2 type transport system ATP-binding protein n=1 Tax=Thermosipho atlanticus DSM 15807 TaxID=1123380 RepID=A0A1M5QNA6_9BACT|nr:ABC transporter ATP-binding protein [Thermosipho atlanticus]SHH15532.1 ABC-2 type transport system ATP-binding protein [Thermosipho atlanticus DSM 15807]
MIEVKNLGKKFKNFWALKNLNFKLEDGEVLGVVGKNGCGKTTLLKLIAGILKPSSGKVITNLKVISYIPEKPILIPELSLEDNLKYFASLRKISKERIYEEIKYFELQVHMKKKTQELSKGLQQRLSMIIALLPDPDIILMDEPTSGLDAESKKLIVNRIRKLRESNKTVLYVTHDDEEIEKVCNKVLILDEGELMFFGSVEDFWKKYERYIYVILEGNNEPLLVKIEELKNLRNVMHVRSVGIREFLSGGVNLEINGKANFIKTHGD